MKSRIAKISITTATILLMMALVMSTVSPIMSAIQNRLQTFKDQILTLVEEKTALRIAYDSISPDLLSGLRLKGVSVYDAFTGDEILSVSQVTVSWKLGRMNFRDVNDILSHIRNVTVEGFVLDWDNSQQASLVQKFLSLSSGRSNPENTERSDRSFNLQLPFGITLRSLSLKYWQNGLAATLEIPLVKLTPRKNGSTDFSLTGHGSVELAEKLFDITDSFNVDMKVRGSLNQEITGSIAHLEVTGSSGDVMKLGTTALTVKLLEDGLDATLISAKKPYSLSLQYGFSESSVSACLSAGMFKPLSLITVRSDNELLEKLQDLTLDGTYAASCNLKDIRNSLQYQVQGTVILPSDLIQGGMTVSLATGGNGRRITIDQLAVVSPSMDIRYNGAFDFATYVPEGELSINRFLLPSGNTLETLFYIEPMDRGFVMFAPQVYAGDRALTAVQAECLVHDSSVDFTLEASDYSHYELETPGVITLTGFASWDQGADLQAAVSLNNFFADSIVDLADSILPQNHALGESVRNLASPYIISLDVYATTDFNGIVYNVPYAVVANTSRSDQMLLLSLGGNETTVTVNQLNLLWNGQEIDATISADADTGYDQVFFGTSLLVNGVPYSLSGAFLDKNFISFQGDYGLDGTVSLSSSGLSGSLYVDGLPARAGTYAFQASADASFDYRSLKDFSVVFNRLSVAENSGTIRIQPSVDLSGTLNQWGMTISSLTFADNIDVLQGNGYLSWTLEPDAATGETILAGGALGLSASNSRQTDSIAVTASFINPLKKSFSSGQLVRDSYIEAQAELNHFAAAHILDGQAPEDTLTATVSLQGSLENPSVYASVPQVSAKIGGSQFSASFDASLEDRLAAIMNGSFGYSMLTLDQTDGFFDLETKEASLTSTLGIDSFIRASSPVSLTASLGGTELSAGLLFEKLVTNVADPVEMYPVRLQRGGGVTALTAGPNEGVQAVLLESGEFFATAVAEFPMLFTASGSTGGGNLDVSVSDVSMDLSLLSRLLSFDYFSMYQGMVTGSVSITGRTSDPQFGGALTVRDMSIGVPAYVANPMQSPEVSITAEENAIYLSGDNFVCDGTPLSVGVGFFFDRWHFDHLTVDLRMDEDAYTPGRFNQVFFDVTGNLNVNLDLYYSSELITVDGDVKCRNTNCVINNNFLAEPEESEGGYNIICNVSIDIGPKAQAFYPSRSNPIVRGLVSANSPISVKYDSVDGTYAVSGNLILRGGEVVYLNRNFYLREGSILMKETESGFNPLVNIRAETRERTNKGDLVRIILSVPNQRIRQINPVLSSDSSLSELEIRTLLGEAILVESGTSTGAMLSQLAASGVDYLIQNSLLRGLENRLRDSLHFDIFSLRSPVVQQLVAAALQDEESVGNINTLKIGNYFDNTTVYIGKYIGTSVYMDAMFSFRYDENKSRGGLTDFVIQPEIGLEFPAPFATIRWSIAPDLTQSLQNLWVPYTSLSLSWKFSL